MFMHTMSSYVGTTINCWSQSFGKRASYSGTDERAQSRVCYVCLYGICAFLSLGGVKVLVCPNFPMSLLKCLLVVLMLHSTVAVAIAKQ